MSGLVRRTSVGHSWPAAARVLPEKPVLTARPPSFALLQPSPQCPTYGLRGQPSVCSVPAWRRWDQVFRRAGGTLCMGPERGRSSQDHPERVTSEVGVTASRLPVTSVGRDVKSGESPASPVLSLWAAGLAVGWPTSSSACVCRCLQPCLGTVAFPFPCHGAPPHSGSLRATRETGGSPAARQSPAWSCYV